MAFPKVSLCMCTYNGEQYLAQQISSIDSQSAVIDEVIVIDDCSTDTTWSILQEWRHSNNNIIIHRHSFNWGVISSFEHALQCCSGDIIILSDQDDIWLSTRVASIRNSLEPLVREPYIFIHDSFIIDGQNQLHPSSFFRLRGSFRPNLISNFIKNKYIGCCMAFTRPLLAMALPFPRYCSMHDQWLGLFGDITGNVIYYPDSLLYYRRHSSNVTHLASNSNLLLILKHRIQYFVCLLQALQRLLFT